MSGWAAAVRAARRTAVRSKGRTALVLTLIALPVAVVVAGETLARTGDISVREALPQTIGAADARILSPGGTGPLLQDPEAALSSCECTGGQQTTAQVLATLPAGSRLLTVADVESGQVSYADGLLSVVAREMDLADPMAKGFYDLEDGRLPASTEEVVVTERVADRGFPVGSTLTLGSRSPTVVGIIYAAPHLYGGDAAIVVSKPGAFGAKAPAFWLADVPGHLSWDDVKHLNQRGLVALSRAVVNDPPPDSEVPTDPSSSHGDVDNSGQRTFVVLVSTLALVQVVLLAAPAFAVGARRQRRVLAMIGATGGAPKHVRRFVLAQGLVLGVVAGVLGAAVGVVAGIALRPALALADTTAGPVDVSYRDAAITAAVGAGAAVLAALVPALVAGRQDVLAGLTGRRGTTTRSLRTLIPGLLVLGLGVLGCVSAASPTAGQFTIVYAALPMVLGAALLAPSVIVLASQRVGRLPFSLRFALRDAARSRGRTAAAAAAVTATVAAAVSLGIGGSSDSLQGRETYVASGPEHAVVVGGLSGISAQQRLAVDRVLERRMPGATRVPLRTLQSQGFLQVADPAHPDVGLLDSYGGSVDGAALVGESGLELLDLPAATRAEAAEALRTKGVVAFVDRASEGPVVVTVHDENGSPTTTGTFPAYRLVSDLHPVPAVVSEAVAAKLGTVTVSGMLVKGDLSKAKQERLNEELQAIGAGYASVERGWSGSSEQRLAMLVVGGTAAVLVIGGTLSAALLALGDARPDFGTLMAVGAAPRVRRRVAAAYAAVIGLLGSLLGTLAGFAPGIAVSYPLTRGSGPGHADHYLDIPWTLVLGLSVLVPLVAALGAALLTRSQLPLAARVET